jgi:hypothetical protein
LEPESFIHSLKGWKQVDKNLGIPHTNDKDQRRSANENLWITAREILIGSLHLIRQIFLFSLYLSFPSPSPAHHSCFLVRRFRHNWRQQWPRLTVLRQCGRRRRPNAAPTRDIAPCMWSWPMSWCSGGGT